MMDDSDLTMWDEEIKAWLAMCLIEKKYIHGVTCKQPGYRLQHFCMRTDGHSGPHMRWVTPIGAEFLRVWSWWNNLDIAYRVFYV